MQDKVHAPRRRGGACLEDVEGFTSASPRQSLTTGAGALRLDPIDGVRYRLARPVSHHHGHLTEAFRADWGLTDAPVVKVNLTTTFPGRIRGWGIHRFTIDRLFAATGSLCIAMTAGTDRLPSAASTSLCWGNETKDWSSSLPGFITVGRISARMRRRSSACPASSTTTTAPIAGNCRGTPTPPAE
jgi:hypothetical protein